MNEFTSLPTLDAPTMGYINDLFGGLVPAMDGVRVQLVHSLHRPSGTWDTWQIGVGDTAMGWSLSVHWPAHKHTGAVLLSPDGCWPHCVGDHAAQIAAANGVALAWFNRLELAHDAPDVQRKGPVFEQWPERHFGAISVWAWGIQRCVDALLLTGRTQAGQVGVVGHSRGGKAALLAGATDLRIGATVSHNSGTGGAASLQRLGTRSESLADLATTYPHWLGPHAAEPEVQQRITACDSLPLLQAIAPRGLCLLQASDDLWANPCGTRYSADQLHPVWVARGVPNHLQWHERTGGHAMGCADWQHAAAFLHGVVSSAQP